MRVRNPTTTCEVLDPISCLACHPRRVFSIQPIASRVAMRVSKSRVLVLVCRMFPAIQWDIEGFKWDLGECMRGLSRDREREREGGDRDFR